MATIIKSKDLADDKAFEPPLVLGRGITEETVKGTRMTLSHNFIPPGARNQRHYHVKADAGMYIIKGRLKILWGPDHDMQEDIAETGDFVLVRNGEIHGLINLSDTEPAEIGACFGSAGSEDEAHTLFVEPPWE